MPRAFAPMLALVCLLPARLFAQDATPPPPPPAREGTVNASYMQTSGNSSTQSLGLDGDTTLRPAKWVLRNKASFVRVKTDGEVTAQAFAFLSRSAREITARLSGYGQFDYLRDTLGGINHRSVITAGASFTALERDAHTLELFGGFGFASERRVVGEDVGDGVFDGGTTYKWKFSDVAEFTDDFRYNQSLDDGADWRLGHLAAVTAKLTEILSLKLSYDVRFRNAPPVGFKSTDTATAIALVVKF